MNVRSYLEKKARLAEQAARAGRGFCTSCRLAIAVCDCKRLSPFNPGIEFVILIHPEEVRRRIATGRLTHLILENSRLLEGESFEDDQRVLNLIERANTKAVVLYPGAGSLNLTRSDAASLESILPRQEKLLVFVIDGTWRTAKKMLRLSPSLDRLPKISFDLPYLSRFEIRKQPGKDCFSTLEAVHHLINLIAHRYGFPTESRKHDHLIAMFDRMVDRQIDYQNRLGSRRRVRSPALNLVEKVTRT